MTTHDFKISDTNDFFIDDDGFKVFPFSKEEAEKFVADYFHKENPPEIVSFHNSSFYLILLRPSECTYYDKNGKFHTFSKIHTD